MTELKETDTLTEYVKLLKNYKKASENFNHTKTFASYEILADAYFKIDNFKKNKTETLNQVMSCALQDYLLNNVEQKYIKLNHVEKFDKLLDLRNARYNDATALINFLQGYEKIHKIRNSYAGAMITSIDKLCDIENALTTDDEIPSQSFLKVPNLKNLKMRDITAYTTEVSKLTTR